MSGWARCESWSCSICAPSKLVRLTETLAFAAGQHAHLQFFTLTDAPAAWKPRHQKMRNLRRCLLNRDRQLEHAWVTERNDNEQVHVHAIAHGDHVPQSLLGEVWGRNVNVQPVMPSEVRNVLGYMLKGGFRDMYTHLDLNNGRAIHKSQAFLSADLRATRQDMRRRLGADLVTWHTEPRWTDAARPTFVTPVLVS